MKQTGKSRQPRRQRNINEVARDERQEIKVDGFRQLKRANRVHPQREDHSPVLGIVTKRKPLVNMPPKAEDEEQRNPPRPCRPEKKRETFQKRQNLAEETPLRRRQNQPRSGQRRNGNRAHIDPVRRRQERRGEINEREAIKDERDEQQVKHTAEQKHAEREEQQQRAVCFETIRQQRP